MTIASARPATQTGAGLIGILLVLSAFGILGMVALKALPAYIEFFTLQTTVKRISNDPLLQTDMARREAFDRQMRVESIRDFTGRDLEISQGVIALHYQKKIPLTTHISLVIDFDASNDQ